MAIGNGIVTSTIKRKYRYSAEDFAKNSWGDVDDYYSTVTSFPMYERISPFLQMIPDDKRFSVRPCDNRIIER
jgi:hypothetical protein